MTRRFDASANRHVKGAHSDDLSEGIDWVGNDDVIWYLTDGQSDGRWLYVNRPDGEDGDIEVGIARVYRKYLSPTAARALAKALLQAADESAAAKSEREARKAARQAESPVFTTSGYSTLTPMVFGGGSR